MEDSGSGFRIREVWISWINDEDVKMSGYVSLLEQTINYLKFKTRQGNIITISYTRLLKMKEKDEQGSS